MGEEKERRAEGRWAGKEEQKTGGERCMDCDRTACQQGRGGMEEEGSTHGESHRRARKRREKGKGKRKEREAESVSAMRRSDGESRTVHCAACI